LYNSAQLTSKTDEAMFCCNSDQLFLFTLILRKVMQKEISIVQNNMNKIGFF